MLTKSFKILSAAFFLISCLSFSVFALKIGFVNSQAVADAHPAYKAKLDQIEKMMEPAKKILQDRNKELEELKKDLAGNPLMSDVVKEKKEKIIEEKSKELSKLWQDFQTTLKAKEQEFLPQEEQKGILKNVMTAIELISKQEGFQVIYELSKGDVVYIEPSLDITERAKTHLQKLVSGELDPLEKPAAKE